MSMSSSMTYLQIKEKAVGLRSFYESRSIPLPNNCGLAELIQNAIDTSDHWLMGSHERISSNRLFGMVQLDRIADAIAPLNEMNDCSRYLIHMTSGNLDPFKRERSKSRDTLWELELLATLKNRRFNAALEEPPDIVVNLNGACIGIACKKFYSTKHVQSVLSDGVAQIEDSFDFGILAVNIDDLIPPDQIFKAPTQDEMGCALSRANFQFLGNHERHFRKYLSTGRLLGALVSIGGIGDVFQDSPRLQTVRQATIWVIPGLAPVKERVIHQFRDLIMG
jgi:hypothetical protein